MDKQEAREGLKRIRKGDIIYSVLRHVSKSGMMRRIDFYKIAKNKPIYLTAYIADFLGYKRYPDKQGLRVDGCGMDMGFNVVYELSVALYGYRKRGGYKINHEWL